MRPPASTFPLATNIVGSRCCTAKSAMRGSQSSERPKVRIPCTGLAPQLVQWAARSENRPVAEIRPADQLLDPISRGSGALLETAPPQNGWAGGSVVIEK